MDSNEKMSEEYEKYSTSTLSGQKKGKLFKRTISRRYTLKDGSLN